MDWREYETLKERGGQYAAVADAMFEDSLRPRRRVLCRKQSTHRRKPVYAGIAVAALIIALICLAILL
jgi:hypothetical protein